MPDGLLSHSIGELARLIAERAISPLDLIGESVESISRCNPNLNAFISYYLEDALERAKVAADEISQGYYRGMMHGIPVALKDNLYIRGKVTTMGSAIHSEFVPDFSATAALRLEAAGAINMGKTLLHEYALGVTSENPHFGTCRNPWDMTKISGGSSGGSAVAVASSLVKAALGTDTSGSIRIPAAICGVVGFKPTYGRVSKHGCFPEAWTLDHVGPMTSTVTDAAIVLDVISGHDYADPSTLNLLPTSTHDSLVTSIDGLTIGIEQDFFFDQIDTTIADVTQIAIKNLEEAGVAFTPVKIPTLAYSTYATTIIDISETTTVHAARLRNDPNSFGDDARSLIELGHRPSAVDYLHAQQIREKVQSEFREAFTQVDAIISPTLPIRTPSLGAATTTLNGHDVDTVEALMRLVGPANLVGLPAISVPGGTIDELPVGVQIIGPRLREATVLKIALALETATSVSSPSFT